MKKMNRWLVAASVAAVLSLSALNGVAQDNGGRPGRGNFDPAQLAQFRERMMDGIKQRMEITDDTEWKAIQPLVQKVMDARMATMSGMGRGFGGRRGGDNNNGDQQQRRGPFGGQTMPEADALQRAVDGKASNAEMKAAIARYAEARKAKQAELERAQAELRKVLSVKQEALATLSGLL